MVHSLYSTFSRAALERKVGKPGLIFPGVKAMQFPKIGACLAVASLLLISPGLAQQKEREVEIHKNVKLIEMSIPNDLPQDIVEQYRAFLPILTESLKENTKDESDKCALTLRVTAGVREIGSAKTKRPMASISAFRRNSKREYLGSFILYSYVNSGPVNKEETTQFLLKQILEPAACTEQ